MTEKSREIFSDGAKLREKLAIYLQTPEKVELYAQAAEAMFAKGGGQFVSFVATWSWWGCLFGALFYVYRRCYLVAFGAFIAQILVNAIPFVGLILVLAGLGIAAKYFIIKDFEKRLDLAQDDDHALARGTNMTACIVICVIWLVLVAIIFAAYGALMGAFLGGFK